jgi:hypothetical protein
VHEFISFANFFLLFFKQLRFYTRTTGTLPGMMSSPETPQHHGSNSNGVNSILLPLRQPIALTTLQSLPLGGFYEDEVYASVVAVLSQSMQCGSDHANRMVAGLAVTVMFRYQNSVRQESLKYTIIDRISQWTGLSRLNASKVAYLSTKIYANAMNPIYMATIGDWAKNLDPGNSFLSEVTKMVLYWKSSFPKKFSFYQLQMKAAELEKQTKQTTVPAPNTIHHNNMMMNQTMPSSLNLADASLIQDAQLLVRRGSSGYGSLASLDQAASMLSSKPMDYLPTSSPHQASVESFMTNLVHRERERLLETMTARQVEEQTSLAAAYRNTNADEVPLPVQEEQVHQSVMKIHNLLG